MANADPFHIRLLKVGTGVELDMCAEYFGVPPRATGEPDQDLRERIDQERHRVETHRHPPTTHTDHVQALLADMRSGEIPDLAESDATGYLIDLTEDLQTLQGLCLRFAEALDRLEQKANR